MKHVLISLIFLFIASVNPSPAAAEKMTITGKAARIIILSGEILHKWHATTELYLLVDLNGVLYDCAVGFGEAKCWTEQ